jgi:hypothetical protein
MAGFSLGFIHIEESKAKMSSAQKNIDKSSENNP